MNSKLVFTKEEDLVFPYPNLALRVNDFLESFLFLFELLDFLLKNIVLVWIVLSVYFALNFIQFGFCRALPKSKSAVGNVVMLLVWGNAENQLYYLVSSHCFFQQFSQRTVPKLNELTSAVLLHLQYCFGEKEKTLVNLLSLVLLN